jgi:hypothetical protein
MTWDGQGTEAGMDSSLDIFRVGHRYLDGEISLDEVQEWLAPRLGEYLVDPRSTASQLVGLLELGSFDIAAGEADEEELDSLINAFLRDNETIQLPNA